MGNVAKLIFGSENKTKGAIRSVIRGVKDVAAGARKATLMLKSMAGGALRAMRGVRNASLLAAGGIAASVREAHMFAIQMAEVQTMTKKADISGFADDVRRLSGEFGMAKDELANGLYNVLSAGIPEDNAIAFLATASKAAVAGVTDVNTAVDALTTVINAYGMNASEAGRVSDVFFAAIKGGKTTFPEMAQGMGQVASVAAQAGISFEQVAAVIATATTQGQKTDTVMTAMRGAILGILKPSVELARSFAKLGTTGEEMLRSQGLQKTLAYISKESRGSVAAMATFLPNVRALPLVLSLTGTNAAKAAQDVNTMTASLGSAGKAFETMDKVRYWEKAWQSFRGVITEFGEAVNTAVGPHIEALARWLGEIADRSDMWARMTEDLTKFASAAVEKLKMVRDLLKEIFGGGERRVSALHDIGSIIKSAFADSVAIMHNGLLPIAYKVGDIVSSAIWNALPKWMRGGSIDPIKKAPPTIVPHDEFGEIDPSRKKNARYIEESPTGNLARTMNEIQNRLSAQDKIESSKSLWTKAEIEGMANAFGAVTERKSSTSQKAYTAAPGAGASQAVTVTKPAIAGAVAGAIEYVNRGVDIGEVFTRMSGQAVSEKKARIMADGSMAVTVTNAGSIV